MSEHLPPPAQPAEVASAEPAPKDASSRPSLLEQFKNPLRWKKSLYDLTVWFLFGGLVTTMLSEFSPGYPIIVGTDSVKTGIYWVDRQAHDYQVEDYVTFPFRPTQAWLQERYGSQRIFTKLVKAVEGDTVYSDDKGLVSVCHTRNAAPQPVCETLGQARTVDRKGRLMTPWLAANQAYTLQTGEVWAHGPNPLSLDSRYYGPVNLTIVRGRAKPLLLWGA